MSKKEVVLVSHNEKETEEIAGKIIRLIKDAKETGVIALFGDLGAGKTVFAKGVAKFLGVKKNVTSPTFIIWKKYKTNSFQWENFVHADLYRVENKKDLLTSGLGKEIKNPKNFIVVEWPENALEIISGKEVCVRIDHGKNERERVIKYKI